MNKSGHVTIAAVEYAASRPPIEVLSLAVLRERVRGEADDFFRPQRVGFDLIIRCGRDTLRHTVDFTEYELSFGDVLWVRAGQVQEWEWFDVEASSPSECGTDESEGTVVLFQPHCLDERARALVDAVDSQLIWRGATTKDSAGAGRLDDLVGTAARRLTPAMYDELSARLLGLLVVELTLAEPVGSFPRAAADETFRALHAEIELRYAQTRTTGDYATSLGYSARTLNRCALRNTGLTVKYLVDRRVLLEAKRMLAHDTTPVQTIGRTLGFDEPTAFSRFFTHRAGVTPVQFRSARAVPRRMARVDP